LTKLTQTEKTTLVLGASPNPERFSNEAVRLLDKSGVPVIALGGRESSIGKIRIRKGKPLDLPGIHTISMYMSARNQKDYYDYLLSLHPQRIIFNPGTINPEFQELARQNGIEVVTGCMLVMLNRGCF
jgi:predicted CoA-binding protein